MASFSDFCEMTRVLARAADVPDYTWFWWKLRPHPRLGTVEIRALDAQASLADTGALVALVHCLARHAAESADTADPPPEVLEEGIFRAARFGVEAELPSADGTLRPVPDLLEDAMARAASHAAELGCEAEIARLPDLLRRGGGAGMQRRCYEIAGLDAVLRELLRMTAEAAADTV
jgi:carboxylate-amine ligase